jgi:glutathione synthase/RimK-type ligase-like ATP-grasp enzyme
MRTHEEIWLLADYRRAFNSTIRNCLGHCSFDLELVKAEFEKHDFIVHILPYSEIDLRRETFKGRLVIYQSAEDPGSRYKDYLEDLLLGIQMQGGVLIPPFHCFRAHHNKVFLEVLRDLTGDPELQHPRARPFGTLEDFRSWRGDYPKVFKKAWGAGSSGVRLAKSSAEAVEIARAISGSSGLVEKVKEYGWRLLRRKAGYVPFSLHRNKFIVQDFIPGLAGDYKVLVYWDKYYVMARKNRPGDFRASGSGFFSWPEAPAAGLLDLARRAFEHFNVPVMSLDLAMAGSTPVLLEFQFVSFGPVAMEHSKWYFQRDGETWGRVEGTSTPEAEYARSVSSFVRADRLRQYATLWPEPFTT